MIETHGLTKRFEDFTAVDNVNLQVGAGQVLVLLGPNGAGKTTTVRMLTAMLRPSAGTARVAGFDVATRSDDVRRAVGVLTEHHGLYGRMNAEEYLNFFAELYQVDRRAAKERIQRLVGLFGLEPAFRRRLGEYSKGMRQKLALVRALLHEPRVLLLDEPTSAMDPESARTVRDAIHQLRSSERTILLCTHNLVEAEELADQVAIIRRGRILMNDSLEGLKIAMLGPREFDLTLTRPLNGWLPALPEGVRLVDQAENRLRFAVKDPAADNPGLLRQFVERQHDVITFQEAPRSLENAYLQAVQLAKTEETHA